MSTRVGRLRRRLRPDRSGGGRYQSWLVHYFGRELAEIDSACKRRDPAACMPLFGELPDSVWAMLLSGEYGGYPEIQRVLPELPPSELQMRWNGASGDELMIQSQAFYTHLKRQAAAHLTGPLSESRVLDYGCGWGRLTRFIARDLPPGSLCGCDPVAEILEVARESGVAAHFARSEFVPERLPFEGRFDLIFAFSVFTHLSEDAHRSCLDAIGDALEPGGLAVVTIRPPAYLNLSPQMAAGRDQLGEHPLAALERPRYVFVPHPSEDSHPQFQGGEMTYGEALIPISYVHEHWTRDFELVDLELPLIDLHQVTLTLRKRDAR